MLRTMDERQWTALLERIDAGICTPFLGAGVNYGILPTGAEIAKRWAEQNDYPLEDSYDLARVAQFVAIDLGDPMLPKDKILRELRKDLEAWLDGVDTDEVFRAPDQPLGVLASLPLPVYVTTNYDDLIVRALRAHTHEGKPKQPKRETCLWNRWVRKKLEGQSVFDAPMGFEPTPAEPVVFHLHGHDELRESVVLTESDYLDFLVNISRDQQVLPSRIQEALAASSLLFIGYRLADWSFRVLLRGIVESMGTGQRRASISVQLPPDVADANRQRVLDYLAEYLGSIGNIDVVVYWDTAEKFTAELRERWERFGK